MKKVPPPPSWEAAGSIHAGLSSWHVTPLKVRPIPSGWIKTTQTKVALYYVCILTKLIWTFGFKDHMSAALLIREVTHSKKSAVVKNNNVILY